MQSIKFVIAAAIMALATQGCSEQGADPATVRADVAKAQAQGDEKIATAQEALEHVKVIANATPVNPDSNSATTSAPLANADTPGAAMTAVDPAKRLADAQYDVEKAKAEQTYNVALARCENRVGDANKACRDLAKSLYDSALDAAKSKRQANPPSNGNGNE